MRRGRRERERWESFRVRLRNDFVRSLDGGWWIVSSSTKIQSGRIFESDFTTVLVRTATKNCISWQLLIISPWIIQAQNYEIFIKYQNCHHLLRFHGSSLKKHRERSNHTFIFFIRFQKYHRILIFYGGSFHNRRERSKPNFFNFQNYHRFFIHVDCSSNGQRERPFLL